MNPHRNIIHKVMPFKKPFSAENKQRCFVETDTMATGRADLRPNVRSSRNAPNRCQTLC
jgi:hypothetical protein